MLKSDEKSNLGIRDFGEPLENQILRQKMEGPGSSSSNTAGSTQKSLMRRRITATAASDASGWGMSVSASGGPGLNRCLFNVIVVDV